MHTTKFAFYVLLLTLSISEVRASGMPNAQFLDLPLEQLLNIKITTSTHSAETIQSVPSSMTVFTRADIQRLGLQHLTDLINLVPGYQSYRSDDGVLINSISSRGRLLGSSGREVLVLIDGQRLNNDWTGGAGQHDSLISIENIDRVEVIRGPGSALYGSNAMMGVINIITHSNRSISIETGGQKRNRVSVQWNAQSDIGSLDIFARSIYSKGEQLNIFEPFPHALTPDYISTSDPFRADDFYLKGVSGDFIVNARASARDSQEFYTIGYVDNQHNLYDTRSYQLNVSWRHNFVDQKNMEIRTFWSRKELNVRSAIALTPVELIFSGAQNEDELGVQWIAEWSYEQANWLLWWEWRNPALTNSAYHYGSETNFHMVQGVQSPEDDRTINSWFAQYRAPLTATMNLTAGLRQDSYSDFGDHLSPRLGVVQQIDTLNTFKLLYSDAFRAPSRIETSIISIAFKSNPDLKPETAKTTELIWVRLLDNGYLTTTMYSTNIRDAIIETVTPQLQRTWVNSRQSISGLEFEWQYQWSQEWQSRVALTHIFHPLADIHTESNDLVGGSVSYVRHGMTLSLLVNYQSKKLDANEQNIPVDITTTERSIFGGHTIFGVYALWKIKSGMEVSLRADNLFDKHYLTPANRASNYIGIPNNGRSVSVGINLTFN